MGYEKSKSKLASLLGFVFFLSGFASLLYQVIWQRLLTLYYGVGTVSISLIVSVYMLGLGLGALAGGFLAERVQNKIKMYATIEILIGCFGLVSLFLLDLLGRTTAGSSYIVSFIYICLFLCIPTLLMGATLPLLIKIFNRLVQNFMFSVSRLYFLNTLGAALGAICCSYLVISFFGLDFGVYMAAGLNFFLAGIIIYSGKMYKHRTPQNIIISSKVFSPSRLGKFAYLLVFITGFLAIGYELVWFRVVGVLVKASPYVFSTVLAVYLSGIALGSYYIDKYLRKHKNIDPASLFFFCNFRSAYIAPQFSAVIVI